MLKDYADFDKYMQSSQKTGYVRATVRQIMREDIQAGKLKLPKELQDQVMQGIGEPIDIYRKVYGEGALEQIDSLADDLGQFRTEEEAAKFVRSKYTFEPKVEPVDESKTYEELEDILKKDPEPEGKAQGGIIGYANGGPIPLGLVDYTGTPWENSFIKVSSPTNKVLKPEYRNGIPLGLPMDSYFMDAPITSESTTNDSIPVTLTERYNKYLSAAGSETGDELYKLYRANLDKKADGGRIGFNKGKRVKSSIDKLLENLNKKTQGKKSMESVDPKTGEVTVPKKPIRKAEEPTGMTTMDPEPEIIDEKSITKTKTKKKTIQRYDQDIIKAADEIFPNYDDPKIAADQIVDSYAQMKFGLEDQYGLSNKERMDLYTQAYDYVMDYNRGAIGKTTNEFNISDPKTAEAFTNFARENDPEGFKKIQKIVDDINNKNMLEDFDIKGREPNANGGIAGLL
jgi:hypothetical protein